MHLYERAGEVFAPRTKLTPPDAAAGISARPWHCPPTAAPPHGAPRSDCAAGARCGVAYVYELRRVLAPLPTLRPATNAEDAKRGHHLALSADGHHAAVQGAVIHVFALDDSG